MNFSDSYQANLGDTFYLINSGSSLENDYLFDSYTISWNGETVKTNSISEILVGGVTFSYSTVLDGEEFADSYVLTVVGGPEPGVAMLVLVAMGGLLLKRAGPSEQIAKILSQSRNSSRAGITLAAMRAGWSMEVHQLSSASCLS